MGYSVVLPAGILRPIAQYFFRLGVDIFWIPALVGALFLPIVFISSYLLESLPDPDETDIKLRTERVPMNRADRWKFLKTFAPSILSFTIFYTLTLSYREFRESFSEEIYNDFQMKSESTFFNISEIIITSAMSIPIFIFMFFPTSIWNLASYHFMSVISCIILTICTFLVHIEYMRSYYFFFIGGVCLYMCYVPFCSLIFEIIISLFQIKSNNGFLMYLCDSSGFVATLIIMFIRNFSSPDLQWKTFFIYFSYFVGIFGCILVTLSMIFFYKKYKKRIDIVEMEEAEDSYSAETSSSTEWVND